MASPMATQQAQNVLPFDSATRRKVTTLPTLTRVSGADQRFDIPRVGILGRLHLGIRGQIGTVTSGPNALGIASILGRVRLQMNNGIDVFNCTGPGYFYLVVPYLDAIGNALPQSTALNAVATNAVVNLDMIIPVQINLRDAVGLINVQNEQTLLSCLVSWATDATVASGGITWTTQPVITPYMEWFTVPPDVRSFPNFNTVHQIIEDQVQVAATGTFTYSWPRGNQYLQMIHGLGFKQASPADGFSKVQLRLNQSDYIMDSDPNFYDMQNGLTRILARNPGVIPFDLVGSTGLGNYDSLRDTIDSRYTTSIDTVLNVTATGTFYAIRRQLVPVIRPQTA